jgi:hypothetical protein
MSFEKNNEKNMPKRIIVIELSKKNPRIYTSLEEYILSLSYYKATKLINRIKTLKHIR